MDDKESETPETSSVCNGNSVDSLEEEDEEEEDKETNQNPEPNPKVIQFAHKVTIDNFKHYIEDAYWKNVKMCFSKLKENNFFSCIKLCPNENIQKNKQLTVYNNFLLFENEKIQVNYRLSMMDGDEKCFFEKEESSQVEVKEEYVWTYDVDFDGLGSENNLEKTDKVVIWCEITINPSDGKQNNNILPKQDIRNLDLDCQSTNVKIIENYFNSKSRVINSLAHKCIIDKFEYFYKDDIFYINLKKFQSSSNKEQRFHLSLYPNGSKDEFTNNLSMFLHHSSPINFDVKTRVKISIIDIKGENINTRGFQCTFNEKLQSWGFGEYISVSQLLDHSNGLLSDGTLTLLCEVQVITDEEIEDNISSIVEMSESHCNAQPRVIYSLAHKWTIKNFIYSYRDEWPTYRIRSHKFNSNPIIKHSYQLFVYPNIHYTCGNNLSIFLRHSTNWLEMIWTNVDVNVRCKISIIDEKGGKRNTKGFQCSFEKSLFSRGINKYISVSELLDHSNGLLSDGTLTLLCEVQVIGDGKAFKLPSICPTTVSKSHVKMPHRIMHSLSLKWTIDRFETFYQDEWQIEKIQSNKLKSSSRIQHKFQLILYPNGDKNKSRNNLSVRLYHHRSDNVHVEARFKISIIDENGDKRNTREVQYTFVVEEIGYWGYGKYISLSQLLDHSNGLLSEGTLTLLCEIQVIADIPKYSNIRPEKSLSSPKVKTVEYYSNVQHIKNQQQTFKFITQAFKSFNLFGKCFSSQPSMKTLEMVLSSLICNNLLLVKLLNHDTFSQDNFSNATLKDVIFTYDPINRDVINKALHLSDAKIEDNVNIFDQLIKSNFNDLISTLGTCVSLRQVINNEINLNSPTSEGRKQLEQNDQQQLQLQQIHL